MSPLLWYVFGLVLSCTTSSFFHELLFPVATLLEAYLGMMRCGASRIERQPRAQKAYAPCASAFGWPDIPPSKVWPGGSESHVHVTCMQRSPKLLLVLRGAQLTSTYIVR